MKKILPLIIVGLLVVATGCKEKTPTEKAIDKMKEGAEAAKDGAKKTGEAIKKGRRKSGTS